MRALHFIITAALATTYVGLASAREPPPPKPLYEEEPVPEPAPVRAHPSTDVDEDITGDAKLTLPNLTPVANVSLGFNLTNPFLDAPAFGLFLGANYYPWPDKYNAFWSLGLKVEQNPDITHNPMSIVPTARSGFAWIHGDPEKFWNKLLPNLQLYGLAGWRLPLDERGARGRVGVGVGSPRISPASLLMVLHGVPVPNQAEVIMEFSPKFDAYDVVFLIGYGI